MTAQDVYLSLGSNVGDRESNLRAAVERLQESIRVTNISSLYETDPVGVLDQAPFLNIALRAETDLSPPDLLRRVKQIERDVGRVPTSRWGPRIIDIDIILDGNEIIDLPELTIPHREMTNRAFVLVPLAEIAPDVVHPVLVESVRHLLARFRDREDVRRLGPF